MKHISTTSILGNIAPLSNGVSKISMQYQEIGKRKNPLFFFIGKSNCINSA